MEAGEQMKVRVRAQILYDIAGKVQDSVDKEEYELAKGLLDVLGGERLVLLAIIEQLLYKK